MEVTAAVLPGARPRSSIIATEFLAGLGTTALDALPEFANGREIVVLVKGRLPVEQGEGYAVQFRNQGFILPLRGHYLPGQHVRVMAPGTTAQSAAEAAGQTGRSLPATGPDTVHLGAHATSVAILLARVAALPPNELPRLAVAPDPAGSPPSAQALHQAVAESGVFYESHLQQWCEGKRPLEAVKREPPAREPGIEAGEMARVPSDTRLAVVREQLQALDFGKLCWQGQAWPHQEIELAISEDRARGAQDTAAAAWTTHLRLQLPRLGEVQAEIRLHGNACRLTLAASAAAEPELRIGAPPLFDAFEKAGLNLATLGFRNDHDR